MYQQIHKIKDALNQPLPGTNSGQQVPFDPSTENENPFEVSADQYEPLDTDRKTHRGQPSESAYDGLDVDEWEENDDEDKNEKKVGKSAWKGLKDAHKKEWEELKERHKAEREALKDEQKTECDALKNRLKTAQKVRKKNHD